MAMMANNDFYASKPKFDRERTEHGLVTLSLANTSTFPNAIIRVVSAGNVANGWVANAVNLGNTFGTQGWNLIGPTVVNVSGNTIFLSQAPGNTLAVGSLITFSNPIVYAGFRANNWANTYNANTYAVSITRMSNANSIVNQSAALYSGNPLVASNVKSSAIAHQGWVWAKPQTGYIRGVNIVNGGNGYANITTTITANAQYPGGSGGAINLFAAANGVLVAANVAPGGNYFVTPAITLPQVNGANHFLVSAISVTGAGSNYVNGFLNISSTTVGTGANASYTIYSANGGINNNSVVINSKGGGYDGNNQNVTVTGVTGTGATFLVTESPGANATVVILMGGRANRVLTEVLAVANTMGIADPTSGGLWFPGS